MVSAGANAKVVRASTTKKPWAAFTAFPSMFTKLTGFTRDDVIGVLSSEIKIWARPEDREKLIKGLIEKGVVENLESLFRCKDGAVKTALMSARIIKLKNEPHILSITRDISERK